MVFRPRRLFVSLGFFSISVFHVSAKFYAGLGSPGCCRFRPQFLGVAASAVFFLGFGLFPVCYGGCLVPPSVLHPSSFGFCSSCLGPCGPWACSSLLGVCLVSRLCPLAVRFYVMYMPWLASFAPGFPGGNVLRLASFALIPGVSCAAVLFALLVSTFCGVVPVPPSVCLFLTLAALFLWSLRCGWCWLCIPPC